MIATIKNIIQENPHWLAHPNRELTFMKVSTPASGREVNYGKVLIFVFEGNKEYPALCVKTVRSYEAKEIIKRNYDNLTAITKDVIGTRFAKLFAEPLHFFDDGVNVFLIESACPGEMFSSQNKDISIVVEEYTAWQEEIARNAPKTLYPKDLNKIVSDFISVLPISPESKELLMKHYESYKIDPKTELPELIQQGDMTPDNVLVHGNEVYFIDYDFVGLSTVPGFDLFHFISKSKSDGATFRQLCDKYFPQYFQRVGAMVTDYMPMLFIYYIQESLRKGVGGKNGKEIIDNFNNLLERK